MKHPRCGSGVRQDTFGHPKLHYVFARRRRGCRSGVYGKWHSGNNKLRILRRQHTPFGLILAWISVLWVSEILRHFSEIAG